MDTDGEVRAGKGGTQGWAPTLRQLQTYSVHPPRPAALNRILVEWLEGLPPDGAMLRVSRL